MSSGFYPRDWVHFFNVPFSYVTTILHAKTQKKRKKRYVSLDVDFPSRQGFYKSNDLMLLSNQQQQKEQQLQQHQRQQRIYLVGVSIYL